MTNNLIEGNFPQRASWSRGHFNSWQTAPTTAYYIWAANHSEKEQKHSRSGRMKRPLSLIWGWGGVVGGCQRKNHVVWKCEDQRCRLLKGKILINTGELFCSFWQNSGRRRQKKVWERNIRDSHLSLEHSVKHSVGLSQLCSAKTMTEVSKSCFSEIRSTLSRMRRPFSVHRIQKMELHQLAC